MPLLARLAVTLFGTGFVFSTTLLAQVDPSIGTWRVNLEKSVYDPGPPPKSETRTLEDRGGGVVIYTQEGINALGRAIYISFTVRYDGRDYPTGVNLATGLRNTTSYRVIDSYNLEITQKVNGKPIAVVIRSVSDDGKTMTYTTKPGSTNAQGQPIRNVIVLEKE